MLVAKQLFCGPYYRTISTLSVWITCTLVLAGGCKRSFYRRTADRDAYCIIHEKGQGPTWNAAEHYTVTPDPRSRFYDPTCPTDPTLPLPAPQLYNYDLPALASTQPKPRDLVASVNQYDIATSSSRTEEVPALESDDAAPTNPAPESPSALPLPIVPEPLNDALDLKPSAIRTEGDARATETQPASIVRSLPPPNEVIAASAIRSGIVSSATPFAVQTLTPEVASWEDQLQQALSALAQFGEEAVVMIPPVPTSAWETLPANCRRRMLEFDAVRREYVRTYGQQVTESQLDPANRVNLENILELALINSREYQTQRETLYRAALRLTLQRFDYQLKPLSRGNGTTLGYNHNRVAGVEVNRLSAGPGIGITKSLYTAGDLTARFANDVILTFNGSSGYSSSVGSAILVDLSQPIIQRDVQFEPLTQAERDVVYAARS